MLRDVREGAVRPLPTAAAVAPSVPDMPRSHELTAVVLGKAVVILPVTAVLAFGLWTGYEAAAGDGVSVVQALLISAGSLALTIAIAFVWASRRSGRR